IADGKGATIARAIRQMHERDNDVRWLSKLQCLSILYWSKDSIAAFIARRNMARGDKTDWGQVDDIKDLELVIRQAAFAKSAAPMKQYISRGNRAGEPTAGYDADEVQKTIDEMEADRKAHDEAKAKKDKKKTSASARRGERALCQAVRVALVRDSAMELQGG
ncbi:hypothetical protein FOZ62_026859, partial [Perkinsus olseni]